MTNFSFRSAGILFVSTVALATTSFANMPEQGYPPIVPNISALWLIPVLAVGILIGYLIGRKKWLGS